MENTSVEGILRKIGFGRVQVQLIIIGALILMTALNETLGTSFFLPASQCDFQLTTSDKGLVAGMCFLGVATSSYFWGFLGDTRGRRWVILISLILSSVFSLTSACMKSFSLFVACRFMVGVFVSGYSTTLYSYIGEFNTDKNRSAIISWMTVSIGLANIFIPMSAMGILSYSWSYELYPGYLFRPWRLLMIFYTLPGIIAALWLLKFPESPRFLLMRNQTDDAIKVMQWINKANAGKVNDMSLMITKLQPETHNKSGSVNNKNKFAIFKSLLDQTLPLLKPPFLIYVAICSILHFGTFAISNGLGVFIPDVLNKLSSSKNHSRICDVLQVKSLQLPVNETIFGPIGCSDTIDDGVFIDTAIFGCFYTAAFAVLAIVVKFVSRKIVLNFTLLMSCVAGFALIQVNEPISMLIAYFSFVIFAGVNVSVINVSACDAIPTNLRSMAVCVAMLFGRLGSVIASNFIGNFVEDYCEFTHYVLASLVAICFGISFLLP